MGLAISQRWCRLMGGDIDVKRATRTDMRHVHAAVRTLFGKGSALDRSGEPNVFCLWLDLVAYRPVIKHLLGHRRGAFGYARDALSATARIYAHLMVTFWSR